MRSELLKKKLSGRRPNGAWERRRLMAKIIDSLKGSANHFQTFGEKYIERPTAFAGEVAAATCTSLILLFCVRRDWPHDFWGGVFFVMFLCWLSAGMAACALWQVKHFAKAADYLPVKLFMSALLFFVAQFSRTDAAQHLSANFPIDPNQLPFALNFGTILIFIGTVSFVFVAALMFCGLVVSVLLLVGSRGKPGSNEAALIALLLVAMLTIPLETVAVVGQALGLSGRTDILMERLAAETDFSVNSLCEGVAPGERVARLGSQGDRGIAVSFGKFVDTPFRQLVSASADKFLPKHAPFHAVNCNVVSDTPGVSTTKLPLPPATKIAP